MNNLSGYLNRHLRATIAASVAGVALVGGGVAYEVANNGSSSAPVASASASPTTVAPPAPSPAAPKKAASHHHGVHGTVSAISGSTWSILTPKGVTKTVTVTATTKFGTKTAPSSAAAFPVGSSVTVLGTPSGTSLTATRILVPKVKAAPTTPATTPVTTTPAS